MPNFQFDSIFLATGVKVKFIWLIHVGKCESIVFISVLGQIVWYYCINLIFKLKVTYL